MYKWRCPYCGKEFEKETKSGIGMAKENHLRTHHKIEEAIMKVKYFINIWQMDHPKMKTAVLLEEFEICKEQYDELKNKITEE